MSSTSSLAKVRRHTSATFVESAPATSHWEGAHDVASSAAVVQPNRAEEFSAATGNGPEFQKQETVMDRATTGTKYPALLVNLFGVGIVGAVLGLVSLIWGAAISANALRTAGLLLLTAATVTIVLTLLRGQDIDEHQ